MTLPTVGFVGMTHLGLNSAVAAAEKGVSVICVDVDCSLIDQLRTGYLPIAEPQFAELLAKNNDSIVFSSDLTTLQRCDLVYVAPDVATDEEGRSDLSVIDALLNAAATSIRPDAVLVVLSQVPPGFTRARCAVHGILFYQVETLIFGRAMERALYPERYIIGAADPVAELPSAYQAFLELFSCPVLKMCYESAELAKISINCCLVASISVANTLAELCEETGADWSEIVPALKLDKRIGQYAYLAPGLGIAGGNLERDLATVMALAAEHGTDAGVVSSWVANSAHRKSWPYRTLRRVILDRHRDAHVAVLGLAYKADTHSTKNSPALALLENIRDCRVTVYDPVVPATVAPGVEGRKDAIEAARDADVLVIMTPWAAFREISPQDLAAVMRGRIVLDPYKVLDRAAATSAGLEYYTLGVASGAGNRMED
ncbi:MAG: nucleotide sugar dehydrogenase [Alphaproteobacteria bacterium]